MLMRIPVTTAPPFCITTQQQQAVAAAGLDTITLAHHPFEDTRYGAQKGEVHPVYV